ncbi:putative cytokinin riboside 5'-monophosphate phosphoribohydrolase LOGL7 [Leucoagaricus sp. SymC.cos]|nr:putative cytokinin riboside 5'-monophosphate phosphoribohydrolase LOGL7 [Leucoagaricus sp. SymC.cos]
MTTDINGTDNRTGGAVAVYCGSSIGKQKVYVAAAYSVGKALASQKRPLVYGGGSTGIMGVVSGAMLEHGGKVTGIVPHAMVLGEGSKVINGEEVKGVELNETGREAVIVQSMHDRKVEMAKRVLEVTTWTQLGIHDKPVVLCNVLGFWEPLRQLIRHSIKEGFIATTGERLIVFVDGPSNPDEHLTFDWGMAALAALDKWDKGNHKPLFDWAQKMNGVKDEEDGKWIAT